jgi:Bacteriophage tail sheath protein
MAEYLTPGVYVEEVPGTPPIVGVPTSIAGFIGAVADGVTMPPLPDGSGNYPVAPVNVPQVIASWDQFKTKFGDFQAGNSVLAHALYGFFLNGGSICYVSRIADIADPAQVTGALQKFEAIDEIAIVVVPGAREVAVQTAIIAHCTLMEDRFAILDGQITETITAAAIRGTVGNSSYAALYFPQLEVFDPITKKNAFVAPSGHIAGIYGRVDQQRGVHKAPANENVIGALGLQYSVSKNEQKLLNPTGVNAIRNLNGNIKVWGGRTLGGQANGEFMYINVRRLMNFMKESIDEGTQFVVFEPNNPALWQRIIRSVTGFLTNVWRDGALFGLTPQQAFYVRCDESTNPPEVRALGQVITEIGVAIVRPAEFVIFRIMQLTGSETTT